MVTCKNSNKTNNLHFYNWAYITLFYEIYDKNVKNICTNDMNIIVKNPLLTTNFSELEVNVWFGI